MLSFRTFAILMIFFAMAMRTTAFDSDTCQKEIREGVYGTTIGLDAHGLPIADVTQSKGVNYTTCIRACGSGTQPFEWSTFSQQFSAWFVPWLALLSQLPFGAEDRLDNVVSVLLAVGSPALAAYSLAVTLLNHRWLEKRLSEIRYPNTQQALSVLSVLQHIPIQLITEGPLLPSLVVLPENDMWWSEMAERAQQTRNWNVPAAVNIAWVLIALIFTIIYSFDDFGSFVSSHGHAVASIWIWLIPLVVGWLRIGSQTEANQLRGALRHSNTTAHVATDANPVRAGTLEEQWALDHAKSKAARVRRDEARTTPIFNYARVFSWSHTSTRLVRTFSAASAMAEVHLSVDRREWVPSPLGRDVIHDDNRTGNADQVIRYCSCFWSKQFHCVLDLEPQSRWPPGVLARVTVAMALALFLQWCTSGAALFITVLTPTTGLGCRSMAYLLYGSVATLSLVCLVLSSFLAHASLLARDSFHRSRAIETPAIALRWTGKTIAIVNAFGIIAACTFQFTNVYSNCFCLSSVISRGKNGGYVLFMTGEDLIALGVRTIWIGGVILASVSAILYGLFVYLVSST